MRYGSRPFIKSITKKTVAYKLTKTSFSALGQICPFGLSLSHFFLRRADLPSFCSLPFFLWKGQFRPRFLAHLILSFTLCHPHFRLIFHCLVQSDIDSTRIFIAPHSSQALFLSSTRHPTPCRPTDPRPTDRPPSDWPPTGLPTDPPDRPSDRPPSDCPTYPTDNQPTVLPTLDP